MERSKLCIYYVFPWFKNVQYALITLTNDVKEILEVLLSFKEDGCFSPSRTDGKFAGSQVINAPSERM